MERRRFDVDGHLVETLGDYPAAVRQVAREENVALIDLNAMSRQFYEALGQKQSRRAFVHYAANTFPGQTLALKDDTHFNAYGAYQLARCVIQGIKASHLELAKYFRDDVKPFDPAHPDPIETWMLPASAALSTLKPDGN